MIESAINRRIESKKDRVGIAGFTLFARTRDVTNYKSQAPTAYLEDGSPVQDHIINDPLTLTIGGVVGDMYIEKTAVEARANKINETIGQTSVYLPKWSQSAIQQANALANKVRDKARQVDNAIRVGSMVLGFQSPTKPPQEAFVDLMEAMHDSRALVKIEMGYRTYDMMRITDLVVTRDADNNALTFSLTAQKIRVVQPVYTQFSELKKSPAKGVKAQVSSKAEKGAQYGKAVPENASMLTSIKRRVLGLL